LLKFFSKKTIFVALICGTFAKSTKHFKL